LKNKIDLLHFRIQNSRAKTFKQCKRRVKD